jgi:hypothetical protein
VWRGQVFVNLDATGASLEQDLGDRYCRHSARPRGNASGGRLSPRHENGVLQFQDLVRAAHRVD